MQRLPNYKDHEFKRNYHIYVDRPLSFWGKCSHYIGYMFAIFCFSTALAMSFLTFLLSISEIENVPSLYLLFCYAIGTLSSIMSFPYVKKVIMDDRSECDRNSYEFITSIALLRNDLQEWEDCLSFFDLERASLIRQRISNKINARFSGLKIHKFCFLVGYGIISLTIGVLGVTQAYSDLNIFSMIFFLFITAVGWLFFCYLIVLPVVGLMLFFVRSVILSNKSHASHVHDIKKYKMYNEKMLNWVKIRKKHSKQAMSLEEYYDTL